jgi:hypothetical protein
LLVAASRFLGTDHSLIGGIVSRKAVKFAKTQS